MSHDTLTARTSIISAGEIAPVFTLMNPTRAEWTLSDAVKKGDVVLCFFPFAFTGVCGTEMQCISKELGTWTSKGAEVVGISCDSTFTLGAWAAAEGFKHTLLSDQHRQVCKAYGIYWADMNTTHRATVVIGKAADGKGRVKFSQSREPKNAMNFGEIMAMIA
jgi:peroxiredoxin